MQRTVEVVYQPEVKGFAGAFLPTVREIVSLGLALAQRRHLPVDKVEVTLFVSHEDLGDKEVVITFATPAEVPDQSAFIEAMTGQLGIWSEGLPAAIKEFFYHVAVDIVSADAYSNVQHR